MAIKKNLLEKFNILLILVLICIAGFNIYQNFSGQANISYIRSHINNEFIFDIPGNDKFTEGQLKGYVAALDDPYSEYIPKSELNKFSDQLNQRYQGIGVVFDFRDLEKSGFIIISKVITNSPAFKNDLKSGDKLIKIEGKTIAKETQDEIVNQIRGEINSSVNLTIQRGGEFLEKKISREKIVSPLVEFSEINDTKLIVISTFGDDVAGKFDEAVKTLEQPDSKIKNLIIDMRDNPGGRLDVAIDLASHFLDEGTTVLNEATKKQTIPLKSIKKPINLAGKLKLKVLINKNSASASEILAIALKEKAGAILYGQKSFGKGVVQKVIELPSGDNLKLTFAKWTSPNGTEINKKGVNVDKEIPIDIDQLKYTLEN